LDVTEVFHVLYSYTFYIIKKNIFHVVQALLQNRMI